MIEEFTKARDILLKDDQVKHVVIKVKVTEEGNMVEVEEESPYAFNKYGLFTNWKFEIRKNRYTTLIEDDSDVTISMYRNEMLGDYLGDVTLMKDGKGVIVRKAWFGQRFSKDIYFKDLELIGIENLEKLEL